MSCRHNLPKVTKYQVPVYESEDSPRPYGYLMMSEKSFQKTFGDLPKDAPIRIIRKKNK